MHPREGARDTLAAVMSYEQSVESVDAAATGRWLSSGSTGHYTRRLRVQPAEAQEAPFHVGAVLYGSRMLLIAARERCQHGLTAGTCDCRLVLDAPSASGTRRPAGDHR